MLFRDYAITAEAIGATLATSEKIRIVAGLLAGIDDDDELYRVAVWFAHGPFPPSDRRRLNVGSALLRQAYALYAADESAAGGTLDYEMFVAARTLVGGTPETIRMLVEARRRAGIEEERFEGLSVLQVHGLYEQLAVTRGTAAKATILAEAWRMMSPLEISYFLKTIEHGTMRIGMSQSLFEQGIALAFGAQLDQIRYAAMVEGDAGEVTLRARHGGLEHAEIRPFRPIDFMLASPLERSLGEEGDVHFLHDPSIDVSSYLAEDKLDGIRAQVHVGSEDGEIRVAIFSRNGAELSASFPDVAAQMAALPDGVVLDGEIVAVTADGRTAHFNNLQQRLGVKKPAERLLLDFPARFIPFDLLVEEGGSCLAEPLETRRARLELIASRHRLHVTGQRPVRDWSDLEEQFEEARARGNEGLMLKRRGSLYEYGKRGRSWLKGKKEGGSIDAVIRYAAAGSGNRSGTLSDFTFGVWLEEADGSRRLVNIGKAYSGYTDEELAELNRQLRPLLGQRFGSTYEVAPSIVCELVFDFIQPNPRTEAGYTLRFPRIRRIRWDRAPEQIDTVAEVERLFHEGLRSPSAHGATFIPDDPGA
jgi:DNA ligase-1